MMNYDNMSPASIFRYLEANANENILSRRERKNLLIKMDIHWFFLHSSFHKKYHKCKQYIGKWKYDALSYEDFFEKILKLLPSVAKGELPVVKFTNYPNVFSGEKKIVIYCFPDGSDPIESKKRLKTELGIDVYWGSERYKE